MNTHVNYEEYICDTETHWIGRQFRFACIRNPMTTLIRTIPGFVEYLTLGGAQHSSSVKIGVLSGFCVVCRQNKIIDLRLVFFKLYLTPPTSQAREAVSRLTESH
jgi:hypothetical protein